MATVDASIPLGFQMPKLTSPMEARGQAMSLQALNQQAQLRQQEIKMGQNTIADQQRMASLYADRENSVDPETGFPTMDAMVKAGISPALIQKMNTAGLEAKSKKTLTEFHQSEAAKIHLKTRQDAIQQIREDSMAAYQEAAALGPQAAKQAGQKVFAEGIAGLKKTGLFSKDESEQMQTEFDPVRVSSRLLGYKQQLEMDEKKKADARAERKETESERHNRASEERLAGIAARAAQAGVPLSDKQALLSGDEFLKTLTQAEANQVRAIGEGRQLLQDMGIRGKARERMSALVNQAYPNYDSGDAKTNRAIEIDFARGKPSQSLQSINAVTEHLDTYRGLAKALDNGDIQLYNKYKTELERATGKTLPNDIKAAAPIIGSEIVKAIVPGGGGVEERKAAMEQWNTALSKKQVESQIDNVYYPLMTGQVDGLRQRYEASGKKDFNKRFLTPGSRKVLNINDGEAKAPPKAAAPSDADKAAVAWAKANPNDPRAKKIMEHNHGI